MMILGAPQSLFMLSFCPYCGGSAAFLTSALLSTLPGSFSDGSLAMGISPSGTLCGSSISLILRLRFACQAGVFTFQFRVEKGGTCWSWIRWRTYGEAKQLIPLNVAKRLATKDRLPMSESRRVLLFRLLASFTWPTGLLSIFHLFIRHRTLTTLKAGARQVIHGPMGRRSWTQCVNHTGRSGGKLAIGTAWGIASRVMSGPTSRYCSLIAGFAGSVTLSWLFARRRNHLEAAGLTAGTAGCLTRIEVDGIKETDFFPAWSVC